MLLGEACDPNSIGRYHRSPLWRAAYAGNDELIRVLLRSGGDPRECDEQGPEFVGHGMLDDCARGDDDDDDDDDDDG